MLPRPYFSGGETFPLFDMCHDTITKGPKCPQEIGGIIARKFEKG